MKVQDSRVEKALQQENILYVKTFGGFAMTWNGRRISTGPKDRDSQISRLLQAVLHSGSRGLSRADLEEILFGEREIGDAAHCLRTILYNTRKRLEKEGLPAVPYVENRRGMYYWTGGIPVEEDARRMEKLYREAEAEKDPDIRLQLYLEACNCYTGEFLPMQTALIWVARESRYYGELFGICVEKAAALLRENKEYDRLELLGRQASRVQPFSEWETVTMEALAALGRGGEARRLYEVTEKAYIDELGFRPAFSVKEFPDRRFGQPEHRYALLDEIRTEFSLTDKNVQGGFLCTYPVFCGIYRMIGRMSGRGGKPSSLMLCTIVDREGTPVREGPALDRLSRQLGEAICHSIRRSDVVCRYGNGQFLALLVNAAREDCPIVQKRISDCYSDGTQKTCVQYFTGSVLPAPEGKRQNEES